MVHIKYIAHLVNIRVSFETESMASDEALEASEKWREALAEATPSRNVEGSDCESQSSNSEDSKTAFDDSGCLKVAAVAATVGITYDFGASSIVKVHIGSLENYARCFPKGYIWAPGVELVSEPRVNEAIIFEDFFTVGLRMPPHPVLTDILRKFHVQLQ
jgi:hypothetical protein